MACGAVLFASPAKGRWGRRAAHGSVGSCFLQQLRFGTPQSATPQSAELTAPLGRGAKGGGLRRCSLCLPCQGEVGQARSAWLGRVAFFSQPLRFATPQSATPPVRNPSGSQANHLPLTGEAMAVPLDRGGDPSVSGADSSPWQGSQGRSTWQGRQPPQSMRLFTAASIYSHTPRKFLFTSLFGMRRTVKP